MTKKDVYVQIKQEELDAVEAKLHRQNGLIAAFAISLWSIPILLSWYFVYQVNDTFAPVMLTVSGGLIGLAVRFHGRGYFASFGGIAFLAHALLVIAAFLFGLGLGQGQSVWAFVLAGLYAFGAWLAVYLARLRVPFSEHKAYFKLTEMESHESGRKIKNRWFVVAPVTFVACCVSLYASLVLLMGVDIFRTTNAEVVREQNAREQFENLAIDVTTASLNNISTAELLRYSYAFHSGYLPNRQGQYQSTYPKSGYKSQRILRYLSEDRAHARATFILGLLTYDQKGNELITQAANEGDKYAMVYLAAEFGCFGNTTQSNELLSRLTRTINEQAVLQEAYAFLDMKSWEICEEFESPKFLLKFTRE